MCNRKERKMPNKRTSEGEKYYALSVLVRPTIYDQIRVEMVRRKISNVKLMISELLIRGLQDMQAEKTNDQNLFFKE